jgi:hypothetical protein
MCPKERWKKKFNLKLRKTVCTYIRIYTYTYVHTFSFQLQHSRQDDGFGETWPKEPPLRSHCANITEGERNWTAPHINMKINIYDKEPWRVASTCLFILIVSISIVLSSYSPVTSILGGLILYDCFRLPPGASAKRNAVHCALLGGQQCALTGRGCCGCCGCGKLHHWELHGVTVRRRCHGDGNRHGIARHDWRRHWRRHHWRRPHYGVAGVASERHLSKDIRQKGVKKLSSSNKQQ